MANSSGAELLARVAAADPIAAKLRALTAGQRPIAFSHVTEAARPFLVAALAREIRQTIWIICPTVRSQELFYETLLNWIPDALFLPEAEFAAIENIIPDPEISAERLALLSRVAREAGPHLIVTTRASLDQSAPKAKALHASVLRVKRGARKSMERLIVSLGEAGYERVAQVATRGQFAVRGGIFDLFSWQAQLPVRLEFFGDEIESLREFDLDTQTAVRNLPAADVLLSATDDQGGTVRDYIAQDHLRIAIEPEARDEDAILVSEGWIDDGPTGAAEDFSGAFYDAEVGEFAVGDFMIAEAKRTQFAARLETWRTEGALVFIYFQTEGEIERFREIMAGTKGALAGIELAEGTLARGFVFPAGQLVILSAAELFGRATTHGRRRLQRAEKHTRNRAQIDFSELTEGDLVVHLEHGVGRFLELMEVPAIGGGTQEVLALEFADDSKLYVPLEQAYLVSRYVGVGKRSPPLSSLADAKWARAKKNAAASIFDYAGKMLAVQAER
ncbi:MAG: transcription-repair coupling factor, partial [Verrucomicrobiota bacterium]|nr:transcription-repair coupling factor [Verrucomicrobiota bacterium]